MSTDMRFGYVEGWKVLEYNACKLFSPVRPMEWDVPVKDAYCFNLAALKRRKDHRTLGMTEEEYQQEVAEHDRDCLCGLYASRDLERLFPYFHVGWRTPLMLARVRGYGRVTEGDKAWRSQSMEIMEVSPLTVNGFPVFYGLGDTVSGVPVCWDLKKFVEKYGEKFTDRLVDEIVLAFPRFPRKEVA